MAVTPSADALVSSTFLSRLNMARFAALRTRTDTCGRVYQIRPTCWCVDLILELVIRFIIFPLPISLCFCYQCDTSRGERSFIPSVYVSHGDLTCKSCWVSHRWPPCTLNRSKSQPGMGRENIASIHAMILHISGRKLQTGHLLRMTIRQLFVAIYHLLLRYQLIHLAQCP